MTIRPAKPASPKQLYWIERCMAEKQLDQLSAEDHAELLRQAEADELVGNWLDKLFALPDKVVEGFVPATEPGLYRTPEGKLYKVQANRAGTNTYAKAETEPGSGKFEYEGGAIRRIDATWKIEAPKPAQKRTRATKVTAENVVGELGRVLDGAFDAKLERKAKARKPYVHSEEHAAPQSRLDDPAYQADLLAAFTKAPANVGAAQ